VQGKEIASRDRWQPKHIVASRAHQLIQQTPPLRVYQINEEVCSGQDTQNLQPIQKHPHEIGRKRAKHPHCSFPIFTLQFQISSGNKQEILMTTTYERDHIVSEIERVLLRPAPQKDGPDLRVLRHVSLKHIH